MAFYSLSLASCELMIERKKIKKKRIKNIRADLNDIAVGSLILSLPQDPRSDAKKKIEGEAT